MMNNRANNLDGKRWLQYSLSVWGDITKTSGEKQFPHPAYFPIALASRLIECFTSENQTLILDPFAGVGSTLVAADQLGKDSIGIELSTEFAAIAKQRISDSKHTESQIYVADSRELLEYVKPNSVDLVVTSPPYWDILLEKRTVDYKESNFYSDMPEDLGNIRNYKQFLKSLGNIFKQVYQAMKPKSYCCVVVMDIRKKNRFYPYHQDISDFMRKIGFIYDDLIIWDRRSAYTKLKPLGYSNVFRINKVHEFILIFQKPMKAKSIRKENEMPFLHGLEPEQLGRIGMVYLEEAVLNVLLEAKGKWLEPSKISERLGIPSSTSDRLGGTQYPLVRGILDKLEDEERVKPSTYQKKERQKWQLTEQEFEKRYDE